MSGSLGEQGMLWEQLQKEKKVNENLNKDIASVVTFFWQCSCK